MNCNTAVRTVGEKEAVMIGTCAWQSLLEEVYTTPKPGLVDLYSTGAHTDMDVHTFEKSAQALKPYFIQMARQGIALRCSPQELFGQIRRTGIAAEHAMFRATGNVNTHKGLIFTLGIFCAAAGRCLWEYGEISEDVLKETQVRMTRETLMEELLALKEKTAVSNGEKNYCNYRTTGIRGEAIQGYPALWQYALPAYRQGIANGYGRNQVKLQTLFLLMSCTEDSNIISRHNVEVLRSVQQEAKDFLDRGGAYREEIRIWKELIDMDAEYICRNISAGGCADLLAVTVFLDKILSQRNC